MCVQAPGSRSRSRSASMDPGGSGADASEQLRDSSAPEESTDLDLPRYAPNWVPVACVCLTGWGAEVALVLGCSHLICRAPRFRADYMPGEAMPCLLLPMASCLRQSVQSRMHVMHGEHLQQLPCL